MKKIKRKFRIKKISLLIFFIPILIILSSNTISSSEVKDKFHSASIRENNDTDSYHFDNLDINLNRVYGNVSQRNWSGGPDQDDYIDQSKYYKKSNIKINDNNTCQLENIGKQELWDEKNTILEKRYGHTAVWDPINQNMLVFGGTVGYSPSIVTDDLWSYNPKSDKWTEKSKQPKGRAFHTAIWNNKTNSMFIFGGDTWSASSSCLNDLWEYQPLYDTWQQMSSAPFNRSEHSAVYDTVHDQMIVYGGKDETYYDSNEIWYYNFSNGTWEKKKDHINVSDHDAAWDSTNNVMLIFGGGYNNLSSGVSQYYNNLSMYEPGSGIWLELSKKDIRYEHTITYSEKYNSIFLFGGLNNTYEDKLWLYNLSYDNWIQLESSPIPLAEHSAIWNNLDNEILIYGGLYSINGNFIVNDKLLSYKLETPSFSSNGFIESSTIDLGKKSKLENVTVNIESLPLRCGTNPIKIQIGISDENEWKYFGPDGTFNSKYDIQNNVKNHIDIDRIQYFRYKLFFSTENSGYTPIISQIEFNYSFYENNTETIFETLDSNMKDGKPIKKVTYFTYEPENTLLSIFLSSSPDLIENQWTEWEKIIDGQQHFLTQTNRFYRFKAILSTTDNSVTPTLSSLNVYFDYNNKKPIIIQPLNNSWINVSQPMFQWSFDEYENTNNQSGFQIQISNDIGFNSIFFDSKIVDSVNSYYTIPINLSDTKYYWRLKTSDGYGSWGLWSDLFTFKVDLIPPGNVIAFSSSHADSSKWYNNNHLFIDWLEPHDEAGIAGFSYEFNKYKICEPDNTVDINNIDYLRKHEYEDTNGMLDYTEVEDGQWYFHIKSVDINGHWSNTTHLNFKIDKALPNYILDVKENMGTGNKLYFNVSANDKQSGIKSIILFWKYSSENFFHEYESNDNINSALFNFSYNIKLHDNQLDKIIYYFKIEDRAGNINFTFEECYNVITIYDDDIPKFIQVTTNYFNNTQYPIKIMVKTEDNIDVISSEIEFIDFNISYNMLEIENDIFTFEINRTILKQLKSYSKNICYFKITVADSSNNKNIFPFQEYYSIDISKIEFGDNIDNVQQENNNMELLLYFLLIIIIFLIFLIILLFGYINETP